MVLPAAPSQRNWHGKAQRPNVNANRQQRNSGTLRSQCASIVTGTQELRICGIAAADQARTKAKSIIRLNGTKF